MADETSIAIGRLEGRIEQVASSATRNEADIGKLNTSVSNLHTRIDEETEQLRRDVFSELSQEVGTLREAVMELREWRARIMGVAIGMTIGSGVLGGGVAAAVLRMLGG